MFDKFDLYETCEEFYHVATDSYQYYLMREDLFIEDTSTATATDLD